MSPEDIDFYFLSSFLSFPSIHVSIFIYMLANCYCLYKYLILAALSTLDYLVLPVFYAEPTFMFSQTQCCHHRID